MANKSFYFSEIDNFNLLTAEEEKALGKKAFKGDAEAQKKLVQSNLKLVIKIANTYKGYDDVEDLINEGNMGLMHAARKFDPDNGARFSTYAGLWIKAYIQKAIRETSTGVRFPAAKYKELKQDKWHFASLDKVVGSEEDGECFGSFLKDDVNALPEETCIEDDTISLVRKIVNSLDPVSKAVICKRYGFDGEEQMSLAEIGKLFGYSKERIRQIEIKAEKTIRIRLERNDYVAGECYVAA